MSTSEDRSLLVETDKGVRLLTLNRPDQRNAFTIELYRALTGALLDADGDASIGAVVLTGAGSVFICGARPGRTGRRPRRRAPLRRSSPSAR